MNASQTGLESWFVAPGHDHGACIDSALAAARELCRARGARLTILRQQVLELVWSGHTPTGAYAILAALQRQGRPAAPPTVYRALDFLVAQGLVHRIESLNAYVGCTTPGSAHAHSFLICGRCGASREVDDRRIGSAIAARCDDEGFVPHRLTLEVHGVCPDCRHDR